MKITPNTIAQALYETLSAAPESEWDHISNEYMNLMVKMGKSQWLKQIVARVKELEQEKHGVTPVTVTVAHKESESVASAVAQQFTGTNNIDLNVVVDKSVIGGMRVETKNQRWDFTMQKQLHSLAESIINE